MGRLTTRRSYAGVRLGVLSVLVAALTACSTGNEGAAGPPRASSSPSTTPTTVPAKPTSSAPVGGQSGGGNIEKAPVLDTGEKAVLLTVANQSGGLQQTLGTINKGNLSVAIDCQGEGSIKVALSSVIDYTQPCHADRVSSNYNKVALGSPRDDVDVKVTVPSGVRWSLTVGQ